MKGLFIVGSAILLTAAMMVLGVVLLVSVVFAAGQDLKPIVDPYLRVQQALAEDSMNGVADAARGIASEAAKLGSSGDAIKSAADELAGAGDLKAARAAFASVGNAIMILAKESGTSFADDVKVAYCPMVRKYWLQKGETIRNPYEGKSMSECGRLNDGIPDLKKDRP